MLELKKGERPQMITRVLDQVPRDTHCALCKKPIISSGVLHGKYVLEPDELLSLGREKAHFEYHKGVWVVMTADSIPARQQLVEFYHKTRCGFRIGARQQLPGDAGRGRR